jgi:hypothetical protein
VNTRLRDRRGQLLMSQFLLVAMGCATMAGGSGADDGSVEDTMEAVDRLRRSYSRTPPDSLKQAIESRLSLIRRLLGGRLRLGQRRELLDAAGWLTLLLGTVHFDLDEIEPAHAWRRVALLLSREVADRELEAWCWETPAWFAFSEQRYRDAVELALTGRSRCSTRRRPGWWSRR